MENEHKITENVVELKPELSVLIAISQIQDIFFKTDDRTIEMGSKYITIGKGI